MGLPRGAAQVRFRHKLSIVLIGLALVPLVAAGFLVLRLLEDNKVTNVDNGLATAVTAGSQAWDAQIAQADTVAATIAANPQVQAAAHGHVQISDSALAGLVPTGPQAIHVANVAIRRNGRTIAGDLPRTPFLEGLVSIDQCRNCSVVVAVPFDDALLTDLSVGGSADTLQGVGIAVNDKLVASTRQVTGAVQGIRIGEPADASVGGVSMRALTAPVHCGGG